MIMDDCILWDGRVGKDGYGGVGRGSLAHRVVYEREVGSIPAGHELDHLCRVRACVNPEHLEPVTPAENRRRAAAAKTHCPHGHEYTPENTYVINHRGRSQRKCKVCWPLKRLES